VKNNIIISVYITNSNYGKYLEKSIQSVLKQTYKFIEIIIIDDASTDNSKKILKKYKTNTKITIIYNKKKKRINTIV
jgi:glycosyltransferase involved in cell wall biosynthesis